MYKDINLLHTFAILKTKAMRTKVWHKALSLHDRILVSLVLTHIRKVKNTHLAIVLARIVIKLKLAVDIHTRKLLYTYPKAYAWIKSMICTGWSMYAFIYDNSIIEWFASISGNG